MGIFSVSGMILGKDPASLSAQNLVSLPRTKVATLKTNDHLNHQAAQYRETLGSGTCLKRAFQLCVKAQSQENRVAAIKTNKTNATNISRPLHGLDEGQQVSIQAKIQNCRLIRPPSR